MRALIFLALLVACSPRVVVLVVRCPAVASSPSTTSLTVPAPTAADGVSIFGVITSEHMLPNPLGSTGGVDTTPLVHCLDGYWSNELNRCARFFEEVNP